MNDALVDKMSDEHGSRVADRLVAPLERAAELRNEAEYEELADHREFGVDDGGKCCKDWSEGQGEALSAHDRAAVEATTADEVSAPKELWNNVLNVVRCNLVDKTCDALLERIPAHALVLDATWIGCSGFCHERL